MGIEEMFRDLKLGGYNLEVTQEARSPSNFHNYFNYSCLLYLYFVSLMERGVNAPSFSNLEKLATVLGIEVFELFMFD